ncbi:MAG: protein translocase subunit SecF, partial [Pseudomonadota bacterium]
MRKLKLVPDDTHIPFLGMRFIALALSSAMVLGSIAMVLIFGLNFGIDFRGGTMIEIGTEEPADIADLRDRLGGLGLGEVQIQEFGAPTDVLIRIETQPGGEGAQRAAVQTVRDELGDTVEYRRVEVVGPTVSGELIEAGVLAIILAVSMMLVYIWFRFEWQFSVGAVVALVHDVVITMGLFAVLQLEFNLSIIAALLTIVGYSMNDTVVV